MILILCGIAACGGKEAGSACRAGTECPGGLCLSPSERFQGGYCSAECTHSACGPGTECRLFGGRAVCLLRCSGAGLCRNGYQCFQGVCQPACSSDGECGAGFRCEGARCQARPGMSTGNACAADSECSSETCVHELCVTRCARDLDCPDGETCTLDRDAAELRSYCVAARGGKEPLAPCKIDDECDRGTCILNACLTHCEAAVECSGAPETRSCTEVPAPLKSQPTSRWPPLRTCLPRNQVFTVSLGQSRSLLIPRTTRSVTLFMSVSGFDENHFVGLTLLRDMDGNDLYKVPSDQAAYYRNPIRYFPDYGTSSLLLSSSPMRAPLRFGVYTMQSVAQDGSGQARSHDIRALYKLFDEPLARGRVPLRFHITDLTSLPTGCRYRDLAAANAEARLSPMVQRLKEIFRQTNLAIELDPVTYVDSDAQNTVQSGSPDTLRSVLRVASARTAAGVDVVLLRAISPHMVLGLAGGIPASPGISGSPHTGAAVSVAPLCVGQPLTTFAVTVAHEIGHTLGLAHNVEQAGAFDPLGDGNDPSESAQMAARNLMFWNAEQAGTLVTYEQGQVLRSMPQVLP